MNDIYYYAAGNKTVGPVTLATLKDILSRVSAASDVWVWKDGARDWVRAERVPELALVTHYAETKRTVPPPIPELSIGETAKKSGNAEAITQSSGPKRSRSVKRWVVGLLIFVAATWIMKSIDDEERAEEAAKKNYFVEHPLTEKQKAANNHFSTCWQYARMPSSVWSDNRRQSMLDSEGCYSDDRDDPRYHDATYPYNSTKPWRR